MPRQYNSSSTSSSSNSSNSRVSSSSTATATAPVSFSTLLPPALHQIAVFSSASSFASSPPRRRLPKGIPLLDTPHETTTAKGDVRAASINNRSTLSEFGVKVGGPSLPVVRAGATFLSTLSASVALSASLQPPSNPCSAPPSPCLDPIWRTGQHSDLRARLNASSNGGRPNQADMSVSASSLDNDAPTRPLPSLDFVPASTDDERQAALRLVADSVAQRRQIASYALMTHPLFLGAMGLVFAGVYKYMYKVPGDAPLMFTTCVGLLMAGLVGVRAAVRPYIELAESVGSRWLAERENSEIVIARWGDGDNRAVIGTLIFNIEKGDKASSSSKRGAKKTAYVRAWTTRQRERGKGVGKGLVEEAAKVAKTHGADSLQWQPGNIYETRILPSWANSGFENGLEACRAKLEQYLTEFSGK